MIQFRDQCHRAVALERFTPDYALEVIRGVLFLFPLFHSRLIIGTS